MSTTRLICLLMAIFGGTAMFIQAVHAKEKNDNLNSQKEQGKRITQSQETIVDVTKAQQLAKQHACMSCHAIERKLVGPAYIDIAKKYKGEKGAAEKLAKKIRTGGMGVWGQIPMPANTAINDADLKVVVAWILAGALKNNKK